MINAEVICDSMNQFGDRLTTMVLTFPRYILSEFNTHRILSKNSASSRAIPLKKMLKAVEENPFVPVGFQIDHQGMQGTEYLTAPIDTAMAHDIWLEARDRAVKSAKALSEGVKVTKQLCNRLLEPFMWHKVLVTGSHWDNFFELRSPQYRYEPENIIFKSRIEYQSYWKECFGDLPPGLEVDLDWLQLNEGKADVHMMLLAEKMYDAYEKSEAVSLNPGEWHIPFGDKMDEEDLLVKFAPTQHYDFVPTLNYLKVKIATARCARVSYNDFEGISNDYVKDFDLYNSLLTRPYTNLKGITFLKSDPIHASPAEHSAMAMGKDDLRSFSKVEFGKLELGWCRNFKGFIQHRAFIENGMA